MIRDTNPGALRRAAKTTAERIVAEIIWDLSDRRGIKHEYAGIDADVRAELVATWEGIAEKHLKADRTLNVTVQAPDPRYETVARLRWLEQIFRTELWSLDLANTAREDADRIEAMIRSGA